MAHTAQTRPFEHNIGLSVAETMFGTAVTPTLWVPGTSSLKTSTGVRHIDRATGRRQRTRYTKQPTHITGSLELEIAPGREAAIKQFLTMKDVRTPNTFTVHDVLGDQVAFQNAGVAANTVSIKCAKGDDLVATIDCIGRERTKLATPTTVPATNTYPVPYVFEELIIEIDGEEHADIEEFELSVDAQLVDDKTGPGSFLLREIPSDGLEVKLTLNHDFEHSDLWEAAMGAEEMAVLLTFTRGEATFVISLPRLIADEGDIDDNMQSLELTALGAADGSVQPVVFDPS